MKKHINKGIIMLSVIGFALSSCTDERSLVIAPDNFEVNVTDQVSMISDTFVVNVNEKITFNFPAGCPDQILFYSGESVPTGGEYRFANRSNYQSNDGTVFESKVSVNTTVKSFVKLLAKDYSLVAVSGLVKSSSTEFNTATKTELMKLRAISFDSLSVTDNYTFTNVSTPLNLKSGDLNFAISAKSADAIKNMLSISAIGFTVTNTEVRDYGYVKKGVTVVNKKTVNYPIIINTLSSAAWGKYAPDSTIAPGGTTKVLNASGYNWNMGEIGETRYQANPSINNGAIPVNFDSVKLATSYPIIVTAPGAVAKKVAAGTTPSETWLISRGLNPAAVTPDPATLVKKVDQSSMLYYQYIYKEKGVYKASIVGMNVGTNGTSKVVREFVILVKGSADSL